MSEAVDEHLDRAFASLDDVPARDLHATAQALERRKGRPGGGSHPSSVTWPMHAGKAGARTFPAFTSGRTSPAPARSWPRRSRMRRPRFGAMCAMRWPHGVPNSPPPADSDHEPLRFGSAPSQVTGSPPPGTQTTITPSGAFICQASNCGCGSQRRCPPSRNPSVKVPSFSTEASSIVFRRRPSTGLRASGGPFGSSSSSSPRSDRLKGDSRTTSIDSVGGDSSDRNDKRTWKSNASRSTRQPSSGTIHPSPCSSSSRAATPSP